MENAFFDTWKSFFLCLKGCYDGLKTLENMRDTWKCCCETRSSCRKVSHLRGQRADRCRKIFAFLSVYFVCRNKFRFSVCVLRECVIFAR